MRASAVYVATLVALMVPMMARAETIQPESAVVSGNAFDVFAFEGEPDEVLIAWGDPMKPRLELPFAVYNGSDEPIVNGQVDAVMASEEWGEPFAFEDEGILPLVIEPGEFGFGRLTFDETAFVFFPEDAEFEGTVGNGEPIEGYLDLGTDNLDLSRSAELEGVVVNTAADPVGKIQVQAICLEPVRYFSNGLREWSPSFLRHRGGCADDCLADQATRTPTAPERVPLGALSAPIASYRPLDCPQVPSRL